MRKGITPIISIIILLLITVALAGAAWTFLQGFLFPQITKSFTIPPGGAFCTKQGDIRTIKIYVLNTAYQSNLIRDDFIIREINGQVATFDDGFTSLNTGNATLVINDDMEEAGWPTGYHSVDLGTGSNVIHVNVFCP